MSKTGPVGKRKRAGGSATSSAQPVGVALQQLIAGLGIAPAMKQYDVLRLWESVVGEQIAHVASAQRIEKGVLYVHVATAPWRAELAMKRMEIMQKINATVGERVVIDIRFR